MSLKFEGAVVTVLASSIALANMAYAADEVNTHKQQDEAQTNASDKEETNTEEVTLNEVNVWGTAVKSSSIVMDDKDIQIKQADHISDLLRTLPGVDVGGSHSLNQRITIRGMDDKDIDIRIDGARQNNYMYHHMGNLQIHADILKSVDVSVGKNSVVNSGLGGGVYFETKEAKELLSAGENWGTRVQAQANSNASKSAAISAYGQIINSIDVLGYFNYVDRDDYTVGGGKILDKDGNEIEGTDGTVKGYAGQLTDGLIKFGWDINQNHRLSLSYENYQDKGDYSYRPDMGLATDKVISDGGSTPLLYPTKLSRDTVTLNYLADIGDHTTVKTSLYTNMSSFWRDETGLLDAWGPDWATVNEGDATNTGLNVLGMTSLGLNVTNDLTYGIEIVDYNTEYKVDGSKEGEEEQRNMAVFIEDKISVGDFEITPGVRYDRSDLDATLTDQSYDNFSGALALAYYIQDNFVVNASSTQLWQAPEISEVFTGAGKDDTPNQDIKAEKGFNHEVGIHWGYQGFLLGTTLFYTEIDDYIYDYAGASKDNIGTMNNRGFEAYAGYVKNQWNIMLALSSARSKLDANEDYAIYDGARLDREQGDTVSLNVDYDIFQHDVTLHWDILAVDDLEKVDDDKQLDGAWGDNSKDGYVVNNISARWAPKQAPGLTLIAGVDNLFDEYYASQSSRTGVTNHPFFGELYLTDYEPGRNVKATVQYQY